jgi:hypothetical protein
VVVVVVVAVVVLVLVLVLVFALLLLTPSGARGAYVFLSAQQNNKQFFGWDLLVSM